MDSIIFDVDGTLWDSTDICAQAWNTILSRETPDAPPVTGQRLKELFGRLLPDIAAILFASESRQRQLELIDQCCQEEHQALLRQCAPLYPDLESVLAALKEKYRLFIVSNCQAGYIEVFLQSSGLGPYFEGHLCPGNTGMPKGANIRRIMSDYSLKSPVYVGDTMGDFNASREAGIPFVYAAYGFGEVPHPDYTIHTPKELLNIF